MAITAQTQKAKMTNHLSTAEQIKLGDKAYNLAWSNNPHGKITGYYKQEYIPAGETVEKFKNMLLIEAIVDPQATIQQYVSGKVKELKERKATDPVVNYNLMENKSTKEVILDFLLSVGDIVEWNAYRYKVLESNKGIMLFAVSKRTYSNSDEFLKSVKANRITWVNQLATATIPVIKLPQ